ncbi:deoxyribodipyrimidine photo-lyase [Photobacterium sanctipauli]|uniref:Deoxyribodipyrimidine photo-lyase n=1 Tax=Photobacterium sanctipauli TaxID=1342794 RepID=A0A2T3NVD4_9GAMM|nr:deoxyribodipyrimidine photo-lyase [Photobacterium sanctipauli]PSW20179.1 deoxyribodipyrimidine photo-lyase [Photobacterium sanctipauli]
MHDHIGLVWFRHDLRVVDNTALIKASEKCNRLVALYTPTPMQWHEHNVSPMQANLIERRLIVLKEQLKQLNIPLIMVEVPDFNSLPQVILELVGELNIKHVFCNKQYEWNENKRDSQVAQLLANNMVRFTSFDDSCVIPPLKVLTKKGEAFKVFTPFKREWLNLFRHQSQQSARPYPVPEPLDAPPLEVEQLDNQKYQHSGRIKLTYPFAETMLWPVDEEAIRQRLVTFCIEKAADYHQNRDIPSIDGTSCLSPYLALGMLSPRQCIAALMAEYPECLEYPDEGAFTWLNEIIWREFYRHLMVAFPKLSRNQPFQPWTSKVPWAHSEDHLRAWQQGRTGFPIVDAAMRQLLATGWMHNRLRMITASFFTKDLLLHWHIGEQWFMSHLIDGDLASNNGGWQWAASTGTDAQPYFRVFNPTTQGERFDPKGEFIRTWVHELKDVPDKYIHQPHNWPQAETLDYPKPIVDHKAARLMAIDVFKKAKGEAS